MGSISQQRKRMKEPTSKKLSVKKPIYQELINPLNEPFS